MIIGINGKIGSGKDTIGEIIQGLCLTNKNQTFEIKKFAGKLKQIGSLLTGIPVEKFEDQEFKKQYMPEEWAVEIWNDPDPIEGNDYRITSRIKYEDDTSLITYNDGLSEAEVFDHEIEKRLMTYREFLQKLGTEAMRDGLHTNVWVNALFADYKYEIHRSEVPTRAAGFIDQHVYPNWIITDMRFPNEMEAVKERGGITIRVVRDNWKPNAGDTILIKVFSNWSTVTYTHTDSEGNHFGVGTDGYKYKSPQIKQSNLHPSETALDDAKFDYEIINDGTIEDLVEKVREILTKENII